MSRSTLGREIRRRVAEPALAEKLHRATLRTVDKRDHLVADLPHWESLRRRARALRREALDRQPELLRTLAERFRERGAAVHRAADAAEACRVVARLVVEAGGTAVKSKSMATEEVGLNAALEAAGCTVVETDLGEWIVQQAGQPPSHVTAPAIHLSVEEVARIFHRTAGTSIPDWALLGEPAEPAVREALARSLSLEARRLLRERFLGAPVGITGANFLVAESGTLVLVENEGNIRLVTTLPRRHVVLAGIDKVIARDEDLGVLLSLLPVSATAQRQSGYLSLLADPHPDLHLVLLDNGRSRLRDDPHRDLLTCIRCGACMNACPVYRVIGGHAYGGTTPGPIGSLLLPHLEGFARHAELPFASSLCGACSDACPVGIPLAERLLELRERLVREGHSRELGWTLGAAARTLLHPGRLRRALGAYRAIPAAARLVPAARRWAAERELPRSAAETFRDRWARRAATAAPPAPDRSGEVPAMAPDPGPRTAEPAPDAGPDPGPAPAGSDTDRADRFARRLAELGPGGETALHRFGRAAEALAFLRRRIAEAPAPGAVVEGEAPRRVEAALGITGAAALLADTGGVVLDLPDRAAGWASLLVETHLVVASVDRLLDGPLELHRRRAERRAAGVWGGVQVQIHGPSRTADIEKTLVIPAHGPRRLEVVLCDEPVDLAPLRRERAGEAGGAPGAGSEPGG